MKIVVYTKPACPQCIWTKNLLNTLHLIFTDLDIITDAAAAREARTLSRELGQTLPFVVVSHANGQGQQRWAGFIPDKIRGLLK
jgi:glutaredoxin-like protein NrdH